MIVLFRASEAWKLDLKSIVCYSSMIGSEVQIVLPICELNVKIQNIFWQTGTCIVCIVWEGTVDS